ncbi:MAG: V-type ATP synthase subunit D, partial [Pseudomonadota bacterium]
MSAATLSKSSLQKETLRLKTFQKYLPSLQLKRQQLMAERMKAEQVLKQTETELAALESALPGRFPMLPGMLHHVEGMVSKVGMDTRIENIVGVRLPVLQEVSFETKPYSLLSTPFWLDAFLEGLRALAGLTVRVSILRERYRCISEALNKTAQRVNLFEKVLIPQAKRDIQRIRIFLSDMER